MRAFLWLLKAFLFFTLFAFALNNQQSVVVNWFFSYAWKAPMVIIVLAAFALGAAFGVLAMTPAWWRHRRRATKLGVAIAQAVPPVPGASSAPPLPDITAVRDGL